MPNPVSSSLDQAEVGEIGSAFSPGEVPVQWAVFVAGMLVAGAVDLLFVSRTREDATSSTCCYQVYMRQIFYWLIVAILLNAFVWKSMGALEGGSWLYGYFLEYLLSVDNLFVFRLVFKAYSTPPSQQDRALFWGVTIAIVLRFFFFGVGTELLSLGFWAQCAFGFALVYSGVKTLRSDDDDEDDPRNNPVVRCIARVLPVHDNYTEDVSCFHRGRLPRASVPGSPGPSVLGAEVEGGTNSEVVASKNAVGPLKVTLLFLVILTLGIIDVVFAVDSVTAKISALAEFPVDVSFFLNLTSSALAMFMLRSLYVLMDRMTHVFRFLGIGVGIVLVLIGVKLILAGFHVEIGMLASAVIIVGVLFVSVLASAVLPQHCEGETPLPSEDGSAKNGSAVASSMREMPAGEGRRPGCTGPAELEN